MVTCSKVMAVEVERSGWISYMLWRQKEKELFRIAHECERK